MKIREHSAVAGIGIIMEREGSTFERVPLAKKPAAKPHYPIARDPKVTAKTKAQKVARRRNRRK